MASPDDSIIQYSGRYISTIDSEVAHLEDDEDTLSMRGILKYKLKDQFINNPGSFPFNFGYSCATHWFAFQLENEGKRPLDLVVEIDNALLDSVSMFITVKDSILEHKLSGKKVDLAQWDIKFRNPSFRVEIPPGKYREIYLKVKGVQFIRVPVKVYSRESFDSYKDKTNLIFSLFYAILFIIIMHNLFLFISSRQFTYLFYLLINAVLVLILINLNGFLFQYFELRFLKLDDLTLPYLALAYALLLFSIGYLRIRKLPKPFFYIFTLAAVAYPVIGAVIYWKHYAFAKAQEPMLIILLIICFSAAIFALQKRYRPAWHYLSGMWVTLLGVCFYLLALKGTFKDSFWMEYALQVGLVIGAALLSIGLSERHKILEKDKLIGLQRQGYLAGVMEFLKELHSGNIEDDIIH